MDQFIKGMELCEGFFRDCAKGIIEERFPGLPYSAGLIGYGSDVLGYDDPVSTDHMWGPRFYLFLRKEDLAKKDAIFRALSENLPCAYRGYSVNFTEPDPNDCGVQHPKWVDSGPVNPLVFIQTFEDYLAEQLGTSDLAHIGPLRWLAFSEHRLLSLVSGRFFVDGLDCAGKLAPIWYYPRDVKLYLIASNWRLIASEQAFVKRCGACGDEIGARIICARLCERLMRLCFLFQDTYAPYSKWFGTAFGRLDVDEKIKAAIHGALAAADPESREDRLVEAQALVGALQNASSLAEFVNVEIKDYFGRDIRVVFAEKFAEAVEKELTGTAFAGVPPFGTLSQVGGIASFTDDLGCERQIMGLYAAEERGI